MNIQSWFSLGLKVWSPCCPRSLLQHQFEGINSSAVSLLYGPTFTSIHDYWKNHSFDYMDLHRQSDVLLFNTLSKFVIVFLPRNKFRLISWLQLAFTVILEPEKIKFVTASTFPPSAAAAAKSLQLGLTLCDPIDGSHQAPPSPGFSRQKHWSGFPFPSPMHESEKWKWSHSVMSDS